MAKLIDILLFLERIIPLGNVALDVYAKVKSDRRPYTSCPSCKTLLWEGDKPQDWMKKVKDHQCNTGDEKGIDAVCCKS